MHKHLLIKIKKKSKFWYIEYKVGDGTRKRVKGYKDKAATSQLAAKLEREAEQAEIGIIERHKKYRKRPLAEHLTDFRDSLVARGNMAKHAEQTVKWIKTVLDDCGFSELTHF